MNSYRRLLFGATAVFLSLLLLVLAVFAWVQTAPGKRQLAGLIENAVSDETISLALGEIEGFLPFDLRLSGLTVADGAGVWLSLDDLTLDWSPLALLSGRLDVERVRVGRIALDRLPDSSSEAEPGGDFSMPIGLRIARFEAAEIVLAEPVLGTAARLSAEGSADLAEPATGFRLSADIRRIDGIEGALAVDLGYDPGSGNLTANIEGAEPPGGVLARMLDLRDLPAVTIRLSGAGPLEDWRGDVTIDGGASFAADAALGVKVEEGGYRLAVDAGATLAGLTLGVAEPLLSGRSTLRGTVLVDRDGVAEIDTVTMAVAAGEVILNGRVDGRRETLDVTVTVLVGAPDVFAALLPDIGWDRASADIRLEGPIGGPRLESTWVAEQAAAGGLAVSRLSSRIAVDRVPFGGWNGEERVPFEGRGTLEGLSAGDSTLEALLAPAIPWELSGDLGRDGAVVIDRLAVDGAGASIMASGAADAGGTVEGGGTLTLADLGVYQAFAGIPLMGRAELDWSARTADTGLAVEVEGTLYDALSGIVEIDALLADTVEIRSAATIAADGTVDVGEFRIDSGGNVIAGTFGFAGNRLSSDWSVTLPSIAGYSDLAGAVLEGRFAATGRVQGPLERLTLQSDLSAEGLVVDGRVVPNLAAIVRLEDLTGPLNGTVRLNAVMLDRPAVLEFGLRLPEAGGVRFDRVSGEFAGLTVSGAVDLHADGRFGGRLTAQADQVAPLAGLFDIPLSGQAHAVASLSSTEAGQRVQVTLDLVDPVFDGEFGAATLSSQVTVDDVLGIPRLDGEATALGARSGGAVFESVRIGARGTVEALAVSLSLAGDRISADGTGELAFAEGGATSMALKTFRAVIREETFELAAPATIAVSPTGISIGRLAVTGGGGRAVATGTIGDTLDVTVTLANVSLALARLADPGFAISGHIDGEARVTGTAEIPLGLFTLRSSDLRSGFAADTGLPPAVVSVSGRWSDGRLSLDATGGLADGARMTVTAALPLVIAPAGTVPIADLSARANGTLDLALFDDLLAAGGNRVEGLLTIDLRVSGTVGDPIVAGTVAMSGGRYENAFYGSRLESISAVIAASGTSLRLTELSATTPGGGTLAGSGSLGLEPDRGYPLLLDVALRNGAVVDTPLASASADADLRLAGALTGRLLLSGEVSILGAEFRVPDRLPVSVPDLPVEEVNLPPQMAADRAARRPAEPAAAVDAELDLVASARQAVYVRGRGLNVELEGNLSIQGSAGAPAIDGELGLRNGTFDLFGRSLTFQRGGLDFDGSSDLDPEIDLLAAADVDQVTVEVGVGGRVSEPRITLTSVPELPQDEIAARLLFGKEVRNLTAFEAVTLAQSLGQLTGLTGGSGGILDEMRQKIGLDRLDVEVGGNGEASVSGGRYLSEGVYVGVEQGLAEQSSRVNVEIELTPNIKVESDVGADSEGRVGVSVEWDY